MIIKNINNINKEARFTIIGSGPASISLALELEKKDIDVTMIEAGDLFPNEDNQKLYEGKNIGDNYFDLDVTRLRCFGGSSQHWAGWCRNPDEYDFNDWPISKTDLDIYLENACEILEIEKKFFSKKINNEMNQIGFNFSPPVRFNEKYYDHIKNSKKISLVLNTSLLKIIGNQDQKVESIDVFNLNKIKNIGVKNLILACGGIENSRILLWSKNNSNNFLKNINPGHYWMEHPHYEVGNFVGKSKNLKKIINTNFSKDNYFFLSFNNDFNNLNKIQNNSIRFQYQTNSNFKDQVIYELSCYGPKFAKELFNLFQNNQACFYKIKMIWEQIPNLDSKIILSSSKKDMFDIPRVELNWKKKINDLNTPLKCLTELGNFFIKNDIGRVGIYDFVQNKSDFPLDDEIGGHHHMGGTRMGNGLDKYDVVDKNLKVLTTQNLYIAGSSVFRSGGHANPTLTIVQLSLKLADHLAKL